MNAGGVPVTYGAPPPNSGNDELKHLREQFTKIEQMQAQTNGQLEVIAQANKALSKSLGLLTSTVEQFTPKPEPDAPNHDWFGLFSRGVYLLERSSIGAPQ